MMNPAQARTYLEVAVLNPGAARQITQSALTVLRELIPAIMTTTGSYLLADWIGRRVGLPEGQRPEPGEFIDMIQQAPIAPAKIATAGGGERIEPPENTLDLRRRITEAVARAAEAEQKAKDALLETLRLKGINV